MINNIFTKLNTCKKISFEACEVDIFKYITVDNVKIKYSLYTIKNLDINKKYQKLYLSGNNHSNNLKDHRNILNCTHLSYNLNSGGEEFFPSKFDNCKYLKLLVQIPNIINNLDNYANLIEVDLNIVNMNKNIFGGIRKCNKITIWTTWINDEDF